MVTLYTSFASLLELVRDGRWGDTNHSLYHFMIFPRLGNLLMLASVVGCPVDRLEPVLQDLVWAEEDGRVSWQHGIRNSPEEMERFGRMLERAREMGAFIPICSRAQAERICSNEMAIRRFLSHSVRFVDDL